MTLTDLLRQTTFLPAQEVWENELDGTVASGSGRCLGFAQDWSLSWSYVELDAQSRRNTIRPADGGAVAGCCR